jgi:hypothetical protein
MEEHIIIPKDWLYKELEVTKERIQEYGDAQYYTSKILLIHKLLEDFNQIKQ